MVHDLKLKPLGTTNILKSFGFRWLRYQNTNMFFFFNWWNRELTLKCKLKCYVKPMKDPLDVSPGKGNQGTTRGKEKILLTSVGIEPTTSGLDLYAVLYEAHERPTGR